jgi:hypothetical protein
LPRKACPELVEGWVFVVTGSFAYHGTMIFRRSRRLLFSVVALATAAAALHPQAPAQSSTSSSSSAKQARKPAASANSGIDSGPVANGVYTNKTLAFSCKIPPGWVLRTDELNAREEEKEEKKEGDAAAQSPAAPASSTGAKVLLAAFSRPPEARAEDVNAAIVIAAESAASYPDLKEAAQYFFPLTEVAKAQGFTADEDPYEIAVGSKTLVRGDFHKDVGTRVLHQSTLAMLSHGYAISITIIGGTDDEVEDLIDGLTFTPSGK